jgi:uncharacterized phage infection (PIP) family protein YhgE
VIQKVNDLLVEMNSERQTFTNKMNTIIESYENSSNQIVQSVTNALNELRAERETFKNITKQALDESNEINQNVADTISASEKALNGALKELQAGRNEFSNTVQNLVKTNQSAFTKFLNEEKTLVEKQGQLSASIKKELSQVFENNKAITHNFMNSIDTMNENVQKMFKAESEELNKTVNDIKNLILATANKSVKSTEELLQKEITAISQELQREISEIKSTQSLTKMTVIADDLEKASKSLEALEKNNVQWISELKGLVEQFKTLNKRI